MENSKVITTYYEEKYQWMKDYMQSFHNADQAINKGILIKEKHTLKVASICAALAKHLHMNEHDVVVAQVIGLFHDIGRFEQFSIYQTFSDALSENHALLGLKTIADKKLLHDLPQADQERIIFAIKNHNAKEIEETEDKRKLCFARLIRDADKLDIFRVLRPYLTFNDAQPCSEPFVEQFQRGGQCDYRLMRTANDHKLVRLLWVYDINFSWILQKVVDWGYVDEIISSLPQTDDMQHGFRLLRDYIKKKLQQEDHIEL